MAIIAGTWDHFVNRVAPLPKGEAKGSWRSGWPDIAALVPWSVWRRSDLRLPSDALYLKMITKVSV